MKLTGFKNLLQTYTQKYGFVIRFFFALLAAFSFSVEITVPKVSYDPLKRHPASLLYLFAARLAKNLPPYHITWFFFALFTYALYTHVQKSPQKFCKPCFLCAGLFGLFMVVGSSFHYLGNWDFVFGGIYQMGLSLTLWLGYTVFFYHCLLFFCQWNNRVQIKPKTVSRFDIWLQKRTILKLSGIIFFCWLPYLVIFFPGSLNNDALRQMAQFFGIRNFVNHHPFASTYLIGAIMWLGRTIYNDNLGVFFNILFQCVFCALTYGTVIHYMIKVHTPKLFWLGALFYYALFPVWPAYGQALIKDTLFAAIFTGYALALLILLVHSRRGIFLIKHYLIFGLYALLMGFLRNNGIYVVIPIGVLMVFYLRKLGRGKLVPYIIGPVILFFLLHSFLLGALQIKKGSLGEMLAVPFQQTARYVRDCGHEVTEKEKEVINQFLEYDQLAEVYDPVKSDPVKNTFKHNSAGQFPAYFKVWFEMFTKHPGVYLQAFIHHTYGYYYPNQALNPSTPYKFYISNVDSYNPGFFQVDYIRRPLFELLRSTLKTTTSAIRFVPGLGVFTLPATYTWIVMVITVWIIRKKDYTALVFVSMAYIHIGICCLSPVNFYVRYGLPLMAITPLLLTLLGESGDQRDAFSRGCCMSNTPSSV